MSDTKLRASLVAIKKHKGSPELLKEKVKKSFSVIHKSRIPEKQKKALFSTLFNTILTILSIGAAAGVVSVINKDTPRASKEERELRDALPVSGVGRKMYDAMRGENSPKTKDKLPIIPVFPPGFGEDNRHGIGYGKKTNKKQRGNYPDKEKIENLRSLGLSINQRFIKK